MRTILLGIAAGIALCGQLGLALSSPAPHKTLTPKIAATPVSLPQGQVRASEVAFPNCPAPAVNGMNVRAVRNGDASLLTIFVVVQNVGNRAFFPHADDTKLKVTMSGQALGSFAVGKLAPSEVKFFSVETRLSGNTLPGDILASLDFGPGAPVGAVANTLDCQASDNSVTRKGPSIRFASIQG